ncbi:hypothetical protein J8281_03605 [Aquimarina sp. U1-2]|uniref:hypothetical protein n=1 Tax=Aquimarina sp. U1-2 TaxID=2823141 RepID=UPI001AECEB8F|nr:hypothetical protein [Aquimarina sp. U1-2]MBP2831264.1 hypothetical protein [Aquimarina sp. U1-2]
MKLSKNSKKAGLALMGSMVGFLTAKYLKTEEIYPFILIGGFVGNFIGEEYIPEDQYSTIGTNGFEGFGQYSTFK